MVNGLQSKAVFTENFNLIYIKFLLPESTKPLFGIHAGVYLVLLAIRYREDDSKSFDVHNLINS